MIWFGWVLWHINHCRLFNTKFSLYIYTKYIGFGLAVFYGISTIGWLVGLFLWHINLCRLLNAKSIFIKIISSIENS